MAKRGPKPKNNIPTEWSSNLAYAVGLLASDGSLSKDGIHIDLTSKDRDQIETFKKCLGLKTKIGIKSSGAVDKKLHYRTQFGNVIFYKWLESIGLYPNKSKTIGVLDIPKEYRFDFLRGHHDGDGCFYSYFDKRWKHSFMFYLTFISASKDHIDWIRSILENDLNVAGHISKGKNSSIYQLRYAKNERLKILREMYHSKDVVCLSRKRLKIEKALSIVGESL